MFYKLYTLDNKFIKETNNFPDNFTGIVDYDNGEKQWWINGKRHRIDGPACEYSNGDKSWFINGKLHRLDGPALDYKDGPKYWYVDGKRIPCNTNEEFKLLIDIMKLKGLL